MKWYGTDAIAYREHSRTVGLDPLEGNDGSACQVTKTIERKRIILLCAHFDYMRN